MVGGLFSALSGTTYKHNKLIGSNVNRIINSVKDRPDPDIVKDWVYACTLSIDKNIESILFDKEADEVFDKVRKADLTEEQVGKAFSILCGFHICLFLLNKENKEFIEEAGLEEDDFNEQIVKSFCMGAKETDIINNAEESNDEAQDFAVEVWDKILSEYWNIDSTLDITLALAILTLQGYQGVFMPTLKSIMTKHLIE